MSAKSNDVLEFSTVIRTPRVVMWDVFEDPVSAILTLFYEYTDGQAEDSRNVKFVDDSGDSVNMAIAKKSNSEQQSEMGTKFICSKWGEIKVAMKLTDLDGKKQTEASFRLDLSKMSSPKKRPEFSSNIEDRFEKCINFVLLRVAKKHGGKLKYSVCVNCPRDIIWADVSDWGNVRWVKGATGVETIGRNKRRIILGSKSVVNSLINISEDTLAYEVLSPEAIGYAYYRGFITVQTNPDKPESTDVFYRNIWLPFHLDEVVKVRESMKKQLHARFLWLKETYEARYKEMLEPPLLKQTPSTDNVPENDSGHDESGSNLVLPVMQGKYKQEVQFTIAASIDPVWEVIQDFGIGCEQWWLRSNFLKFEGGEEKQFIGCVRNLSRRNLLARDKLIFLSPNDYKLMFETVEFIPNQYGFSNYSVLLALEPGHLEPDDETEIMVTVTYDCPAVIKPTVESQQHALILDSLRRLNDLFKRPLGKIEITLVQAEDIGLDRFTTTDSYCSLSVDHGEVVTSSVVPSTSNPKWNESFSFSVYSASSVVNVALWDKGVSETAESAPPEDDLLGLITFELPNKASSADSKYKVDISTGRIFFKIKFSSSNNGRGKLATKPSVVRQVNYLRDCLVATYLELPQLRNDKFQWKVQKPLKLAQDIQMENLPGYWELVPHMERTNPANMSTLLAELAMCTSSFRGHVVSPKANVKSRIEAIYCKYLPIPESTLANFENDNDFCTRFFIGLSPNIIRCVKSVDEVPSGIRKNVAEGALKDSISKRELFLVSLADKFERLQHPESPVLVSPSMLFCGSHSEGFKVLGISIGKSQDKIYSPHTLENAYRLSKVYLMNAVVIHHVYFNVVLRNFFLESICFAVHKCLPVTHPIRKILLPCLSEIAHKAVFLRSVFTDQRSKFPDYVFTIGKLNGIDLLAQFSREHATIGAYFDVRKDLENRGFHFTCPSYLYQHDVIRLLDIVTHEVAQYLSKHFKIDRDVESDDKLSSFFDTLTDKEQCNLNLGGLGRVNTRSKLSKFVSSVLFMATAHTSAFEKNLYDDAALTSGVTMMLERPIPAPDEPCPDNLFDYFFAPNDDLFLHVLLCRVLSVNTSQPLAHSGSLIGHKLSEKLLKLSTDIKNRNAQLRTEKKLSSFFEYSRLDPFNIPSVAGL